jgi:hypothetical protein
MSSTESQIRAAAAIDPVLPGLLTDGAGPFRWFNVQLPQGSEFPAVLVRRISSIHMYTHDIRTLGGGEQANRSELEQILFQFDVISAQAEQGSQVYGAVRSFLDNLDLTGPDTGDFAQWGAFILSQRAGMSFQLQPPAWVQTIDARIWAVEPYGGPV